MLKHFNDPAPHSYTNTICILLLVIFPRILY